MRTREEKEECKRCEMKENEGEKEAENHKSRTKKSTNARRL